MCPTFNCLLPRVGVLDCLLIAPKSQSLDPRFLICDTTQCMGTTHLSLLHGPVELGGRGTGKTTDTQAVGCFVISHFVLTH